MTASPASICRYCDGNICYCGSGLQCHTLTGNGINCPHCGQFNRSNERYCNYCGGDLFDTIKKYGKRVIDFFKGVRQGAPPLVRDLLARLGDQPIIDMSVCRIPITAAIEHAANLLSLGKFNQKKKENSYDRLFHLFLVVTLQDGTILHVEKNQTAEIYPINPLYISKSHCINVNLTHSVSLNVLFTNAEAYQGSNFWLYDAFKNNCQDFVTSILKGNHLGNNEIYKFVKQDVSTLIIKPFDRIARFVTDLAARFDILLHGLGF